MCTKKARLASVWPMLAWLNTASSPQNATYVVGTLVAGWGILLDGAPNISPNSIGKPTLLKGSFKGKLKEKLLTIVCALEIYFG